MKIVILLCVCAAVLSFPVPEETQVRTQPALKHEETRNENGEYTLHYVTPEGISVSERGSLVPTADGTDSVLIYEGEYSFVGDDGRRYTTKYTTDIQGAHQPTGDHLPRTPELEVLKEPVVMVTPTVAIPESPVLLV